jgi:hypothetical protein
LKLRLKEDPKEWRKTTWLTALPLTLISCLLYWRGVLSRPVWLAILGTLAALALAAWIQPSWFRAYYRGSTRVGFVLSQILAKVALWLLFLFVLTPLGLVLRLLGKDLLRLKRTSHANTYWTPSKAISPLDRLF